METTFIFILATFSSLGLCCELMFRPIYDDVVCSLLNNVYVGGKERYTTAEEFANANRMIERLNKAYPDILATLEKNKKDPGKMSEKGLIQLKNTLDRATTDLYNRTTVLKFGTDVHNKAEEVYNFIHENVDGMSQRNLDVLQELYETLQHFPSELYCELHNILKGCGEAKQAKWIR